MAKQRGYEIAHEYTDIISGAKSKRPGLDQLLADARRHRFDIVLVAAFDRVARSVRHFLEVLDELSHLNIEFVSLRENIDTGGPLGRAIVVIVGAIAELEKSLIVERVRAGMRRAKLEGRRIGRAPLNIDRAQVVADRLSGMSLTSVAKKYHVSRATVCRLVNESGGTRSHSQVIKKKLCSPPKQVIGRLPPNLRLHAVVGRLRPSSCGNPVGRYGHVGQKSVSG